MSEEGDRASSGHLSRKRAEFPGCSHPGAEDNMRRLALILGTTLLLATAVLQAGSRSGQQQNNTPLA